MLVIGLGHRARQGKDLAARAIVAECARRGLYAKQYAFADALKAYCRVAFKMRQKDARLLQLVGTDVFRTSDPDVWVRVLIDTMREQEPDVAVITDMRFPNEADAVVDLGGYTMKVERLGFIVTDRDPNHPSETALSHYVFDEYVAACEGDIAGLQVSALLAFDALYDRYQRAHRGAVS